MEIVRTWLEAMARALKESVLTKPEENDFGIMHSDCTITMLPEWSLRTGPAKAFAATTAKISHPE